MNYDTSSSKTKYKPEKEFKFLELKTEIRPKPEPRQQNWSLKHEILKPTKKKKSSPPVGQKKKHGQKNQEEEEEANTKLRLSSKYSGSGWGGLEALTRLARVVALLDCLWSSCAELPSSFLELAFLLAPFLIVPLSEIRSGEREKEKI